MSSSIFSQGIEFFNGTWEEALQLAYEEEKVIFVDAYTTWCGPCKRMAKNTFTDEKVGEFFNANFINVKLDMEQEEGLKWRKDYPVSAYPTLYFIGPDGEVVLKSVGGKQPKDFLVLGEKASKGHDTSKKYAALYDNGDRSFETTYKYIKALNRANKPSLKISNGYLASQDNLTSEENLMFILEAAIRVDSKTFEHLESYKNEIVKLTSKEEVDERILFAAHNTVQKAIEFEAESILIEAQNAIKKHLPQKADHFASRSSMDFALAMRDEAAYEKIAKTFIKKHVANDHDALLDVARETSAYFKNSPKMMELAVNTAGAAYEIEATIDCALDYAKLLEKTGNSKKAISIIDYQIENSGADSSTIKQLKLFKRRLQTS